MSSLLCSAVIDGRTVTQLGHLLRALNKGRKKGAKRVQAHNYAAPGHTVEDDLADQMDEFFKKFPKRQGPDSVPPLNPDSTLYGMWRYSYHHVLFTHAIL